METLMDEFCDTIHNFFVKEIHEGTFTISGKTMEADFLQENQYFRIVGSVFNDGVWKYPASDMTDEVFTGEVWEMAVPPSAISLINDIQTWQTEFGSVTGSNFSPFQSESFNNYSYSKGTVTHADGSSGTPTWKDVFADRMSRWRKLP